MVSGHFLDTFGSCDDGAKRTRATADGWGARRCGSGQVSLSPRVTNASPHTCATQSVRLTFLSLKTRLKHTAEHRGSPGASGDMVMAVKPSGLRKKHLCGSRKSSRFIDQPCHTPLQMWVPLGWASVGRHQKHLKSHLWAEIMFQEPIIYIKVLQI